MNLFRAKNWFRRTLGMEPELRPNFCYGQDGEDLILDRLLNHQEKGFFVDVGAHHPLRFSNTFLFYKRGWHGINIDAMPGSMKKFNKLRPRDINIECGVASASNMLTYYQFNEPALNTFDPAEAKLKNTAPYQLLNTVPIKVERLDKLLSQNLPSGKRIDFLTIDVEGFDAEVLRSNDWVSFRPRFILAETLRVDILQIAECPVVKFLLSVGYRPVAKAYNTTFFIEESE